MHESPRLIAAGRHLTPPGRDFPRHQHGCWEVVYYVSGRAACPIGERTYDATPGTVLATPPSTPHAELTRTGYTNQFLQIEAAADWAVPTVCFDDGAGSIARVVDVLVREFARPGTDAARLLALLLGELEIHLRRAAASGRPTESERIVAEAERRLQEGFASGIRVEQVASDLGVSSSTLRGYFARHRDTGPRDFLRRVRLQHALGYLRNSTLTLQAIAELTGYDSVSHLSRHVKAATGATPGSLRRRA
ncbi:MAG TPA: AraC family transcriptional regulator [Actinopolymorphaceae bacterium]